MPKDPAERKAIAAKARPGASRVMTLIGRLVHHVEGGGASPQATGRENPKKDEKARAQSGRGTGERAADAPQPARQRTAKRDRGWER